MKKTVFSILIFVLLPIVSKAQLISYEPFNYTPSAVSGLSTQSSMVWKWVNSGDSIFVNSASLSYPLLLASQGNKVAPSINCSSILPPRVKVVNDCVSPLVNTAEPCTIGK